MDRAKMDRARSSRGITWIEVVVVLAIIGVLLALLLPALQRVRESSRRTSCANNLRQLGLALNHFEQSRTYLPPGALSDTNIPTEAHDQLGIPVQAEHNWIPYALMFIERTSLKDNYSMMVDWRSEINQKARETFLPSLQCPSTPLAYRTDSGQWRGLKWKAAPTDYAALNGVDRQLFGIGLIDAATNAAPAGMLRVNTLARITENIDGTSHTIWVTEDAGRPYRYHSGWRRRTGRNSGGGWADRENSIELHGYDEAAQKSPGACALNCTNDNEVFAFHPEGAQVLMGDNSVHFIKQGVEIRVLASLVTIAAGELGRELGPP